MKARIIAFYLPQYHPIPENDAWWGKGFTEWTNVGKAKPLYRGHYQPRVPADLGYYDLRVPETRQAQADMARSYGVEGFMYWHYWFGGGKRLLERPFNEVLASGEPDFPFALAWANETWKGFAHGLTNRNTLIEQRYLGEQDYIDHFHAVLPAFRDRRYITVDGKPLFMVYKPLQHPDMQAFVELWQRLARENGLPGIYFVGQAFIEDCKSVLSLGLDAVNTNRLLDCVRLGPCLVKSGGGYRSIGSDIPAYSTTAALRHGSSASRKRICDIFRLSFRVGIILLEAAPKVSCWIMAHPKSLGCTLHAYWTSLQKSLPSNG